MRNERENERQVRQGKQTWVKTGDAKAGETQGKEETERIDEEEREITRG
jgi:hypothetical protein